MPTATHKQRVLNRMLTTLKRDTRAAEPESRPVLEQLLYAVCREGTTRTRADQAFRAFQHAYYDWNEVRVSSARELAETLSMLPEAELRATRIIGILQEVFETTYSFDLESLHKKGFKQAEKQLQRYEGANAFSVAFTLQMGLGGHSLPLDAGMRRTLVRLDVVEPHANDEAIQASLEHLVPKARGAFFCELLSGVAHEHCHEKSPTCPRCPMLEVCPTGQANQKNGRAGRTSRPAAQAAVRSKAR